MQESSDALLQQDSILDLPDEVKKNIVGYEDMELDEMLTSIFSARTHGVDADRVILLLWQQFKKSPARTKVLARLRHLSDIGVLIKVDGARSMYQFKTTTERS